jgi:hypothetical protein
MGSGGNKTPAPPPANPAIQAVNTPSAFEKIAEERLKKFSDWENAAGPHDILDAPGMSDMLDIYGSADSLANQKRMSNPAVALSGGGSGDYAKQLDELGKQNRYDDRAAGLSHGLQSARSEAYGLGGSAAELEASRKQAYASDMLNQENAYYNRPKKQSPWLTFAKIAAGGLQGAGI